MHSKCAFRVHVQGELYHVSRQFRKFRRRTLRYLAKLSYSFFSFSKNELILIFGRLFNEVSWNQTYLYNATAVNILKV